MATLSPPTSPQHRDYREHRPRMSTSASFLSNRSRRSSGSFNKVDLVENARDKKKLHTKADPSVALAEAQPAAVALEASLLEDIRLVAHKDTDGNVITDPDRSNPTRHRLERPLDTIRAFNAAADGTSNRRSSYQNRPSPGFGYTSPDGNRRTSYYGNGNFSPPPRPRPGAGGYYRNSSYNVRPESYVEEPNASQIPYGRPPRVQSQPYHGNGEMSSSPGHSYQQSYETVNSGSDDYGKSTNPSSQNSSFDRLHQMHRQKPDEFGQYDDLQPVQPLNNGYGQQYPPHNGQNGNYAGNYNAQNGNYNRPAQRNGPLSPPQSVARVPIKLTTSNSGPPPTQADLNKALPAKRQSWFKRKMNRSDS